MIVCGVMLVSQDLFLRQTLLHVREGLGAVARTRLSRLLRVLNLDIRSDHTAALLLLCRRLCCRDNICGIVQHRCAIRAIMMMVLVAGTWRSLWKRRVRLAITLLRARLVDTLPVFPTSSSEDVSRS